MGLLTFSINVTLDGCVDHQEGIADDDTYAFFTRLMDEGGAMRWGRATYEMMESYWPAVARGDAEAPPAMREWAVKLEAKPKYGCPRRERTSRGPTATTLPATCAPAYRVKKDATPDGVLLGSGKLATGAGPAGSDRRVQVTRLLQYQKATARPSTRAGCPARAHSSSPRRSRSRAARSPRHAARALTRRWVMLLNNALHSDGPSVARPAGSARRWATAL